MELEMMGIDLTRLAFVALGNAILVATGAGLVAYLERVIKRWEKKEAQKWFPRFSPPLPTEPGNLSLAGPEHHVPLRDYSFDSTSMLHH